MYKGRDKGMPGRSSSLILILVPGEAAGNQWDRNTRAKSLRAKLLLIGTPKLYEYRKLASKSGPQKSELT